MKILPPTIETKKIRLELFDVRHIHGLKSISFNDEIWEFLPRKIHSELDFDAYYQWMTEGIDKGNIFVYTIFDKIAEQIIGSSSFLNYDAVNKKIEIGGTWLTPSYWGTNANIEAKYLLLDLCFSKNYLARVEFKTREANIRSQKAIEKLGATKEGMFRMDRINGDGSFRNTIIYSIIKTDWPDVKMRLESALDEF